MKTFQSGPSGASFRRSERLGRSRTADRPETEKPKHAWKLLPDVWALIKPRGGILAVGLALIVINRLSGLVLPASTKYLIDGVILKRQTGLLTPLVLAVVAATAVQGLTSYSLIQLLSKSSQRMIAGLRVKVQAHIGRLPVTFYDANKSGALVSRKQRAIDAFPRYTSNYPGIPGEHKTGALEDLRNDVGIAETPVGPIVMAGFAYDSPDPQWTADNAAQLVLGRLAKAALTHLLPAQTAAKAAK